MPRARLALLLLLAAPAHLRAADPDTADVFVPKTDGFKSIRIPAAVVTNKGTLLAFAEGRAADADQAKNKIIAKRSTDGGKTWGKVAVIADGGDRALNNPCAVVERGSGQVLLMYQSYPAGVSERSGKIQPGYEGELVVRNWLVASDDDGVTWGKPRDITRETKREKVVTTVAGGPCSRSTKGRSGSGTSTPCTATTRARRGRWATRPRAGWSRPRRAKPAW
jgi:sialidase-1